MSALVPLHVRVSQLPRRYTRVTVALVALVLVLGLISAGYEATWSGFADKTLWDWLDLLVVPVVLGVGGYLFTRTENRSSLAIAEQRAQDETLQGYIDQMSQLMIEQGLRGTSTTDDVSVSARARTLTVLRRLDGDRKASLLRFLHEAGLIDEGKTIIELGDADLSETNLFTPGIGSVMRRATLKKAALAGVDLSHANLTLVVLTGSDLSGAELSNVMARGVHLEQTDLTDAAMLEADLVGAWLVGARLTGANMKWAVLRSANLRDAKLGNTSGDPLKSALLVDADLSRADLTNADLTNVSFARCNLIEADFSGADLQGANFKDANLRDAIITDEQLAECSSLEGAVMPNGLLPDGTVPDKPQQ
jgi:uncharacterized protein YjbI with pentapeptide repeats